MAFDNFLKSLFKKISTNKAVSGYSIGPLEKVIDIVSKPGKDVSDIKYLPKFLKQPNNHYIIEFKSHQDRYSESDFSKTAMYKWGYCTNEKLFFHDIISYVKGCLLVSKKEFWVIDAIRSAT